MFTIEKLAVSFTMEIKSKKKIRSYAELAEKLGVIHGKYSGLARNKEMSLFFYTVAGYLIKPHRREGNYLVFRSDTTMHIDMYYHGINPSYPLNWTFYGADINFNPSVIVDFSLSIEKTLMKTEPLPVAIYKATHPLVRGHGEYRAELFENFGFSLEGYEDEIVLLNEGGALVFHE